MSVVFLTARYSVQFSSVSQSCPTLCVPMNRSTPGLPVYHQLPEFTQTHVHRVGDAGPCKNQWLPAPLLSNSWPLKTGSKGNFLVTDRWVNLLLAPLSKSLQTIWKWRESIITKWTRKEPELQSTKGRIPAECCKTRLKARETLRDKAASKCEAAHRRP